MECIIHYSNYDANKYFKIKILSETNIQRIREAKFEREKDDSEKRHIQCETIPDCIDNTKQGIHLQPCYALFTNILSKKPKSDTTLTRSSRRLSSPPPTKSSRSVYAKECNLCNKYHIKVNKKDQYPTTITTLKCRAVY